ncbi:MAG: hypothetical protein KIT25_15600 [Enhydrobacter sp.]|nr:MAG: hypothetical protein KIT25_15600 [Enhydrobacter sp.]
MPTSRMARRVAVGALIAFVLAPFGAVAQPFGPKDLRTETGTVLALDFETRTVVVNFEARGGELAFNVMDGAPNFSRLMPGAKVEVRYYRIVDVLVGKTSPPVLAQVRTLLSDPNQAPTLPGTQRRARLWGVAGMVARVDLPGKKVAVANGGMIYLSPTIRSEAGLAALKTLQPGDKANLVFTERTIVDIKPL